MKLFVNSVVKNFSYFFDENIRLVDVSDPRQLPLSQQDLLVQSPDLYVELFDERETIFQYFGIQDCVRFTLSVLLAHFFLFLNLRYKITSPLLHLIQLFNHFFFYRLGCPGVLIRYVVQLLNVS